MKDKQKFLKNSLHFPHSENKTDVENRKKKIVYPFSIQLNVPNSLEKDSINKLIVICNAKILLKCF